jgi:hypothetical protein
MLKQLSEVLIYCIPIIILELALEIYCIIDMARKGVKNLNIVAWIIIVVLFNLIGSIVYLLVGRKGDSN